MSAGLPSCSTRSLLTHRLDVTTCWKAATLARRRGKLVVENIAFFLFWTIILHLSLKIRCWKKWPPRMGSNNTSKNSPVICFRYRRMWTVFTPPMRGYGAVFELSWKLPLSLLQWLSLRKEHWMCGWVQTKMLFWILSFLTLVRFQQTHAFS